MFAGSSSSSPLKHKVWLCQTVEVLSWEARVSRGTSPKAAIGTQWTRFKPIHPWFLSIRRFGSQENLVHLVTTRTLGWGFKWWRSWFVKTHTILSCLIPNRSAIIGTNRHQRQETIALLCHHMSASKAVGLGSGFAHHVHSKGFFVVSRVNGIIRHTMQWHNP